MRLPFAREGGYLSAGHDPRKHNHKIQKSKPKTEGDRAWHLPLAGQSARPNDTGLSASSSASNWDKKISVPTPVPVGSCPCLTLSRRGKVVIFPPTSCEENQGSQETRDGGTEAPPRRVSVNKPPRPRPPLSIDHIAPKRRPRHWGVRFGGPGEKRIGC